MVYILVAETGVYAQHETVRPRLDLGSIVLVRYRACYTQFYRHVYEPSGFARRQIMTHLPNRVLATAEGPGGEQNDRMLPPVELAVAVVRKVPFE